MTHPSGAQQSLARGPAAALIAGSSPTLASTTEIGHAPLPAVLPASSAISAMWPHAASSSAISHDGE
eukprot:2068180-Pyramimonas_sp.AAC.2